MTLACADAKIPQKGRGIPFTATPTIATAQQPASATVGSSIADQATVSGGNNPTGTVTFNRYDNPNATGASLFTGTETLAGGTATSKGCTAAAGSKGPQHPHADMLVFAALSTFGVATPATPGSRVISEGKNMTSPLSPERARSSIINAQLYMVRWARSGRVLASAIGGDR